GDLLDRRDEEALRFRSCPEELGRIQYRKAALGEREPYPRGRAFATRGHRGGGLQGVLRVFRGGARARPYAPGRATRRTHPAQGPARQGNRRAARAPLYRRSARGRFLGAEVGKEIRRTGAERGKDGDQ